MQPVIKEIGAKAMTESDFARLSAFISYHYGVRYAPVKKNILENRLMKRLHHHGFASFSQYCDLITDSAHNQTELVEMINLVTTNKTDFFRESNHFAFLTDHLIPQFEAASARLPLKVWSAGCSSGEEVYTLAMVLQEYRESNGTALSYQILGTDISTKVLQQACSGIYDIGRIADIPHEIKKKYFLRGKDSKANVVKVKPVLRQQLSFRQLNFMDADYQLEEQFDLILFRNVMIYFTRDIQEKVINKLCKSLRPGGYLFLGHSESIIDMNVPLKQIKPTVFQRL